MFTSGINIGSTTLWTDAVKWGLNWIPFLPRLQWHGGIVFRHCAPPTEFKWLGFLLNDGVHLCQVESPVNYSQARNLLARPMLRRESMRNECIPCPDCGEKHFLFFRSGICWEVLTACAKCVGWCLREQYGSSLARYDCAWLGVQRIQNGPRGGCCYQRWGVLVAMWFVGDAANLLDHLWRKRWGNNVGKYVSSGQHHAVIE